MAHSKITEFNINGSDFYHYSASDGRSSCTTLMVNGKTHSSDGFFRKIVEASGDGGLVLRERLYSRYLFGGSIPTEFDKKVEFSLNGTTFSRHLHTDRKYGPVPHDYEIDGQSVSAVDFNAAIDQKIGDAGRLMYHGLMTLHPSFERKKPEGMASDLDDSPSP
ncbi:hypothetical protein [Pseudomonas putida]|uniref:Uncharacterized protein n=1 Tax=Pseudomonas putida TaxID=303 RepID=A0A8I1EFQ3_PSEPU|nr:hypothetical protein [Pseudomonas putida]MBI6885824.1 hypothetical protein [Pseudomonas putida]